MDESWKRPLRPASRGRIEIVREGARRHRDGDALDAEEGECVLRVETLPVEAGRRNRRVRQPGKRDVVEDVVSCEAARLSGKGACDELVAARVVIEQVRRQPDWGI